MGILPSSTFTRQFLCNGFHYIVILAIWPLLVPLSGSIVVTLDEVVHAMKMVAERAHVIAEGAAGCAVAAALSGRAGSGKVVAIVSGGNIDLTRFASLVGACA